MNDLIIYLIDMLGEKFIFIEHPVPFSNRGEKFIQVYKRDNITPFVRIHLEEYTIAGQGLNDHFIRIRDNDDELLSTIHKNGLS